MRQVPYRRLPNPNLARMASVLPWYIVARSSIPKHLPPPWLQLLEKVWDYCNMIRIYTKPKGQIPDYNEPVILHDTNPSLEMFCNRIHKVTYLPICAEFFAYV